MNREPQSPEEYAALWAKLEATAEAARLVLAATIESAGLSKLARAELEAVHAGVREDQARLRASIERATSKRDVATRLAAGHLATISATRLRAQIAGFAIPARPTARQGQQ